MQALDLTALARLLARMEDLFARIDKLEKNVMARFEKLSKWLHLDNILAVLTFVTVLPNAYFLSSSLTQTLFSALSNSLAFFNIKGEDKQPLDFNSIVGEAIDEVAKEKELKDALKDADPSSKPQIEANKVKEKEAASNSKSSGNPVKEEDLFPSI